MNEKEQKLLEGFSKLLGKPEVSDSFKEIDENFLLKSKEKINYTVWCKSFRNFCFCDSERNLANFTVFKRALDS